MTKNPNQGLFSFFEGGGGIKVLLIVEIDRIKKNPNQGFFFFFFFLEREIGGGGGGGGISSNKKGYRQMDTEGYNIIQPFFKWACNKIYSVNVAFPLNKFRPKFLM